MSGSRRPRQSVYQERQATSIAWRWCSLVAMSATLVFVTVPGAQYVNELPHHSIFIFEREAFQVLIVHLDSHGQWDFGYRHLPP